MEENDMTNKELLPKIHLVMDKLMNLGGADYENDRSVGKEEASRGIIARDFGIEEWDWPQGVGLYGLLKLQRFYGDNRYLEFFDSWFENNFKKGLPSKNINTTAPYLVLAELLDDLKNPEYEKLCLDHAHWLMTGLPKTKEGGFQHVVTAIGDRDGILLNEGEMWIDTLFMAVLFLNKMGHRFQNQEWIGEALHQVLLHIKYLYDKHTGLFYHGWSFLLNNNFGGVFWCRGNSWFTYGILEFIESYEGTIDHGLLTYLTDTFKAQVNALIGLQAPSGLWHTVLTDPSSYEEVSGSGAIAGGILKGIKMGILDESYYVCADRAVKAVCKNIGEDGTVLNVSAGTGMGYDEDHYKNITIRPMAYGQSLALISLVEALNE
ncbi:glycosyl hydrolase family 88 [Lacrimispora celerecrescens]|uniref:Glycosyl hydrolase family 88 n=2 Tax=Lacrimispora celerecrescens TaxID=29354 RepID=A0A084JMH6_9FIRM|nr:glycosyl hydrolase family 88 [Lacrimispora celerecrescens]